MADASDPTELTVVVTTHNRADLIDDTLAALAAQRWNGDWDVLLLDNGSTDHTPEILERWVEKMPVPARIVTAGERHNPSYARNAAVDSTTATSVAFVDDDDLIADGWVAAIGTALRTHELVGSRHEYHRLNHPSFARERCGQTATLNRFYDLPVVSGGGMGCRRALWLTVGGSNEAFRTGQDIDFALRVARIGTVTPHLCLDAEYSVRLRDGARAAFEQGERMGRALVRLRAVHTPALETTPGATRRWLRRWVALVLRMKKLRSETQRRRWAGDVGHELGRLRGMVAHRTWCP